MYVSKLCVYSMACLSILVRGPCRVKQHKAPSCFPRYSGQQHPSLLTQDFHLLGAEKHILLSVNTVEFPMNCCKQITRSTIKDKEIIYLTNCLQIKINIRSLNT